MDIEFVRTFLAVVETGNFIRSAKKLYLTQAAVSRRISALEGYLGCELFVRNKAGASLTPAGRRFLRYATSMVQAMERARHAVGVAHDFQGALAVGGRFGLWDGLLVPWLNTMSETYPDVQIRAQIGFEKDLMTDLIDGTLDIGVMYTPQNRPGLRVENLLDEELTLVTSDPADAQAPNPHRYVHVDWGPEFLTQLAGSLPEFSSPQIIVGIGWIGLQRILTTNGSGYFPRRLVEAHILQNRLFPVDTAPSFELPAYLVYPDAPSNPIVSSMIEALHRVSETMTR
jgi:DNA-binding transcriptional LysR family regulator